MTNFKIGDVVRLKHDTNNLVWMTVIAFAKKYACDPNYSLDVVWFDKENHLQQARFAQDALYVAANRNNT